MKERKKNNNKEKDVLKNPVCGGGKNRGKKKGLKNQTHR